MFHPSFVLKAMILSTPLDKTDGEVSSFVCDLFGAIHLVDYEFTVLVLT